MLTILETNNTNLSFIIRKNPSSGMVVKPVRKGNVFGLYNKDNSKYLLYFKDAANEISFRENSEETFEYMNKTRYNSPMAAISSITELLASAFKQKIDEDIEGCNYSIKFPILDIKRKTLEIFKKHFENQFDINYKEIVFHNYEVTISTTQGIYELLNFTLLFLIYAVGTQYNAEYIDTEAIKKYMRCLEIIDPPYFVRYMFKTHFFKSGKEFESNKSVLEKSGRYKISLVSGNTLLARQKYVESNLNFVNNILDFGCGEGNYFYLARKCPNFYFAYDRDMYKLQEKLESKKEENVILLDSLQNISGKVDIILTEVLEHNELEEAYKLLKNLCKMDFGSIVITVPNKNFNKYYGFEENDKRHDDHKFEPTSGEFKQIVFEAVKDLRSDVVFSSVGDIVDNEPVTLGCVIRKR